MEHHSHRTSGNIKIAFFLNLAFAIIELIGGLMINSVAILSDALHDLGDSFSLGIAWIFEHISNRDPDNKYSYGYGRFSLLSAYINATILIVGSSIILLEAVRRLSSPEQTKPGGMIAFAILGIAVNGLAALKLKGEQSLNARMVGLHLLEDVIGWALVLVGGILLYFFDLPLIDPLLAVLLSAYILFNVMRNLKETVALFLQRTPKNIDLDILQRKLRSCSSVLSNHDTHIWSLDGNRHVITTHIVVTEDTNKNALKEIKKECKSVLMDTFNFIHVTIEFEYPSECCPESDS